MEKVIGIEKSINNSYELFKSDNDLVNFDFVFYLQSNFNFRFSEVNVIEIHQLLFNNQISFKISKSHQSIIIRDEFAFNFLKNYYLNHNTTVFRISYKAYLYYLNQYHSDIFCKTTRKNIHRSHAMRYRNTKKLMNYTDNADIIKDSLHHKSESSQSYYKK